MESVTSYQEKQFGKRNIPRCILASGVGILFGFVLIAAVSAGIKFNYEDELPMETWGILFWGEHYIIRALWSLLTTGIAAVLAGLIARTNGGLVGILSAVPSILLWLGGIYLWAIAPYDLATFGFDTVSWQSKVMSILTVLLSFPVANLCGLHGQELADDWADFFDERDRSIFGIKWYHYFWIPIPLYAIVMQSAWAIDYGLAWWRIVAWDWDTSLLSIVPSLFLMGIIMTLVITWTGLSQAYDLLSNYSHEYSRREVTIGVIKNGIGYPILAMVAQVLISLAHYGLWLLLE